ncbi:hypothetical protein MMC29_002689, partial [Sticta canariensis]|nr:hypothetical protein [Sticta canariensis]
MSISKMPLPLKMSKNELFDHDFLATVDREWVPVSDVKCPNLGILDLTNEDRGVIKDNSRKGSPCSIRYLRCIKFNLLAMVMAFPMGFHDKTYSPERYLDHEYPQLERLHKHPELFPSKAIEENFHYDVSIICDLLLNVGIPKATEVSEMREGMGKMVEQHAINIHLPARDERRKIWQQFLHNNAPGSGIHPSHMTHPFALGGMKITQAVPTSILKIHSGLHRERDSILEDLKIDDPTSTTPPTEIYQIVLRGPSFLTQRVMADGSLCTKWAAQHCLPPMLPLTEAADARNRLLDGPMSLEQLNQ